MLEDPGSHAQERALAAPGGVTGFGDGPDLYPSLTARGNLAALAALRGRGAPTAGIDDVLKQVGLTDVADDKVRGFSLGMRQRLGLAAALLTKPRLLVLDERSNGLDPAGKKHVHGVLTRLAADGATVVLSTPSDVTRLSRRGSRPGQQPGRDPPRACPRKRPWASSAVTDTGPSARVPAKPPLTGRPRHLVSRAPSRHNRRPCLTYHKHHTIFWKIIHDNLSGRPAAASSPRRGQSSRGRPSSGGRERYRPDRLGLPA